MASGTRSFTKTITFNRPANTTQYAAGDGVSDNATTPTVATFTLKGMAPSYGMGGVITGVTLHKSDQDLTGADFDVYFFDTAVVATGFEDNAAIAITDAEWKTMVDFVQLTASSDGVSVVTGDAFGKTNLDIHYRCAAESTDLYVVIVARGTYTPASAETFTLRVKGRVN